MSYFRRPHNHLTRLHYHIPSSNIHPLLFPVILSLCWRIYFLFFSRHSLPHKASRYSSSVGDSPVRIRTCATAAKTSISTIFLISVNRFDLKTLCKCGPNWPQKESMRKPKKSGIWVEDNDHIRRFSFLSLLNFFTCYALLSLFLHLSTYL